MLDLRGKNITVAGLGRFGGGIAVAKWLVDQGATVLVTDQAPAETLQDSVAQLAGLPIRFRLGEFHPDDFTTPDLVVASPAIPLHSQHLAAARDAGVPVTTEIRLFIERCQATVVGVTGTKGKSTTTAMLGRMLNTVRKTWVGGNIGKSLLPDLPGIGSSDLVLLELSSYMLEHLRPLRWSPHVAVVTMIGADHLDWHGGLEGYVSAKKVIVENQTATDHAVLNATDPAARALADVVRSKPHLYEVSGRKRFDLRLAGEHNQLNAQGAFAAASIFGVTFDQAQEAIRDFNGLPHRLELVHERNGVRYVNDSIATIPDAAIAAINAFPERRVLQIVGGYDKHLPMNDLCHTLANRAKAVLTIGTTGPAIAEAIGAHSPTSVYQCGDLATAMKMARSLARSGDVVLLSTGCASYDQFANFEQRGEAFRRLATEGG